MTQVQILMKNGAVIKYADTVGINADYQLTKDSESFDVEIEYNGEREINGIFGDVVEFGSTSDYIRSGIKELHIYND